MQQSREISIADILYLLGIDYESRGSINIPCPICDTAGRKKHLNINMQKNVWRCNHCLTSGGRLDLYAFFTGRTLDQVGRTESKDEILARLDTGSEFIPEKHVKKDIVPVIQYEAIDIEERHETYKFLFDMCSLQENHLENLTNRGLSLEFIEQKGYKSTPTIGRNHIVRIMQDKGITMHGVPGFFQMNNIWKLIRLKEGIMIPVRDINGRIQGLQIRYDKVEDENDARYKWLSSGYSDNGCKSLAWCHYVGNKYDEEVVITEGPLKGDAINYFTGKSVLAIPGVNSLFYLEEAIIALIGFGLKRAYIALDMDMFQNINVVRGYMNLKEMLNKYLKHKTLLWNTNCKGLDDYLKENKEVRLKY